MAMYGIIESLLGTKWAEILTPLWFAFLVLMIAYSAFEPNAGFRYLRL
jgi:hypothetical protein